MNAETENFGVLQIVIEDNYQQNLNSNKNIKFTKKSNALNSMLKMQS